MTYVDALSELENSDDGAPPWADFVFDIVSARLDRNLDGNLSSIKLEARGLIEAGEVGFSIGMSMADWREEQDANFPTRLFWGYATLDSLGEPTDRLVELYRLWWDLPELTGKTVLPLKLLAAGFGAHPGDGAAEVIHTKLFFEPREKPFEANHPEHGQLFVNYSLTQRRVWLREKDPSFRRPVLSWLTGEFGSASVPTDLGNA